LSLVPLLLTAHAERVSPRAAKVDPAPKGLLYMDLLIRVATPTRLRPLQMGLKVNKRKWRMSGRR